MLQTTLPNNNIIKSGSFVDAPQYRKRPAPPPSPEGTPKIFRNIYTHTCCVSYHLSKRAAYIWLRSSLKTIYWPGISLWFINFRRKHFNKMKYAVVYWIATNETSCFGRQLLLCSRCQHGLIQMQRRKE